MSIITVENLGKKYIISHQSQQRYVSFRDVIINRAKRYSRNLLNLFKSCQPLNKFNDTREEFWALKDVSFEVKQGERIGIIGRNGAGKSTLLKILSRITDPSTGRVILKGRVASLLEVGTGFHPELTGRENIFLNGAILGMTKQEIKTKFDEIVDFSGVEKFLDTPAKRYSSGMYVRLAFAVAAHLEPEILLIDEVLAVGDIEFQRKCLGKMNDVSKKEGRTVLFVSHNMAAITSFCEKTIMLKQGEIDYIGETEKAIEKYLSIDSKNNQVEFNLSNAPRSGGYLKAIKRAWIEDDNSRKTNTVFMGSKIKICLEYEFKEEKNNIDFLIGIDNIFGNRMFTLSNQLIGKTFISSKKGIVVFEIDELILNSGRYFVNFQISDYYLLLDSVNSAIEFNVESFDIYNSGKNPAIAQSLFYIKGNVILN